MKPCPACAEQVQDEAKVCRFCGYDFKKRRNPQFTSGDAAGCAVSGCAAWLLWPFAAILVLALIAALLPKTKEEVSPPPAAIPTVQPGTVNQQALDDLFAPKKRHQR